MTRMLLIVAGFLPATAIVTTPCQIATAADAADVSSLVKQLRAVGTKGDGHRQAQSAWKALSEASAEQLREILTGMKGASPLGENWIRAVVEVIVQRELEAGRQLPVDDLESFLQDTTQSPRARRLAYEVIGQVDDSASGRLIPGLMNDPSTELRRDAVAVALENAGKVENAGRREQAIRDYQQAFESARDLDQIKDAVKKLRSFGLDPNVAQQMGFLLEWNLIGPFDNDGDAGFDRAYPPERELDLDAEYEGKVGKVHWISHKSSDNYGIIDLNVAFERPTDGKALKLTVEHKGAVAYASADFFSDTEREVQLRIGCINGHKVWLNQQLLTRNHVYHAGMEVDQYVAKGRLKAGRNTILVKIAQNEQNEDWAQRWQFQLRVCDVIGTAVPSKKRPNDQ